LTGSISRVPGWHFYRPCLCCGELVTPSSWRTENRCS
jgi:hypothetical protein